MPVEFVDENTPRMNWEKYLERIRYAFGENVELADAYCEGYEDGIRGHAQYGEKGEEGYAGQAKEKICMIRAFATLKKTRVLRLQSGLHSPS
ncbi:MAG: hypothetical protein OXJ55_10780 [Caldilineaceae bacterium]|nr:hypothetical protein [Caldilineaceae bacterium]MDE0463100.1 hypothetical protein [Caldilineaceae bacterium]